MFFHHNYISQTILSHVDEKIQLFLLMILKCGGKKYKYFRYIMKHSKIYSSWRISICKRLLLSSNLLIDFYFLNVIFSSQDIHYKNIYSLRCLNMPDYILFVKLN